MGFKEATPKPEGNIAPGVSGEVAELPVLSEEQRLQLLTEFRSHMDGEFQRFLAQRTAALPAIKQEHGHRSTGERPIKQEALLNTVDAGVGTAATKREMEEHGDANPRPHKRLAKAKTKTIIELLDSDDEEDDIITID